MNATPPHIVPKLISKPRPVPRRFYQASPREVAPLLLGKLLVHSYRGKRLIGRITEVEAYLGLTDPASHAFIGRTAANSVLFGPPGISYVYFIYGMYDCLNVSCHPDGEPGGILFRAVEPLEGISTMARLRGLPATATAKALTGGPGRLCQAFGINKAAHNGLDMTSPDSPLQILNDGYRPENIEITKRIGIRKAIDEPLRFLTAGISK